MKTSDPSRLREDESTKAAIQSKQSTSWFALPAPLRSLFDTFPLLTYDENELPQRISTARAQHTLHIFTLQDEELSPNPACLKWQAWLLAKRLPFRVVSANNHASPTGALPFVLPAQVSRKDPQPQAITSSKIQRWAETQDMIEEPFDMRLEAYMTLIEQNVRNAWLYFLYLQPENFATVARKLYVETSSSNSMVRAALAHQLQTAAREQVLRTRSRIDAEEIYEAADSAFSALATALSDNSFSSKTNSPSLFDVTLFSYTHLLLRFGQNSQSLIRWSNTALLDILLQHEKLVSHSQRVLDFCLEST